MFINIVFLSFSLTHTLLFFIYGFNHYYLLIAAPRYTPPNLPPDPSSYRPRVAIHLPVYNEKYFVRRLVEACARMAEEYGIRRLNILIIDDFLLGCGVSLSNTVEAGKALLTNRNWVFKGTPKYAIHHDKGDWRDKTYQVSLDIVCFQELAFVSLGRISIVYSIWNSNLGVLLILVPFTAAYAFVSTLTILESRAEGGA